MYDLQVSICGIVAMYFRVSAILIKTSAVFFLLFVWSPLLCSAPSRPAGCQQLALHPHI